MFEPSEKQSGNGTENLPQVEFEVKVEFINGNALIHWRKPVPEKHVGIEPGWICTYVPISVWEQLQMKK
jgi:hypothetical protein